VTEVPSADPNSIRAPVATVIAISLAPDAGQKTKSPRRAGARGSYWGEN
jgi:hypothetical protein